MPVEAESWLAAQPKMPNGKVDGRLLVTEGQRRGYCICPRPLRSMIDFSPESFAEAGLPPMVCGLCGQPDTRQSWAFWHQDVPE